MAGANRPASASNLPNKREEVVADINVERKRRNVLPLVLGLLALLALAYLLYSLLDRDEEERDEVGPPPDTVTVAPAATGAVAQAPAFLFVPAS